MNSGALRERLASPDEIAHLCRALCRVLLVDFICFEYALPACCAREINVTELVCPVVVGTFLPSV